MNSLLNKLSVKKRQLVKEISTVEQELETLRHKKLDYVNLFTDSLITKEELIEYRELTDQKIRNLQSHKTQLEEQIQECANENFVYNLGDKLTKVLKLKELTPRFFIHWLIKLPVNKTAAFVFNTASLILFKKHKKGNTHKG
ncbi:hypothetical protein QUF84_03755 [Fictibacillus enclensis]|uniref:hypothetical protein n=1 Tax=Fictibacillus enclensis TaxID=1017270 RepID=UPI0025A09BCC|nr:hypothetical protein [Fictibacillus enclensis]MDM5336349.1 hypothetical protein [Fictibacillus enclensis]